MQNHERGQKVVRQGTDQYNCTIVQYTHGLVYVFYLEKKNRNVVSDSNRNQTGEKIPYAQLLCIRKPGGRVMKLINKRALVCAARCCAVVPGCP